MVSNFHVQEIEEQLESDDELPNVYHEVPDIPAYQNDNRFETIQFPWIENKHVLELYGPRQQTSSLYFYPEDDPVNTDTICEEEPKKTLIKKGILSEQDIFCLKCIASIFTDKSALLWFIDFLICKDMQSDFNFLTSCLVNDVNNDYFNKSKTYDYIFNKESYIFDVNVKVTT